MDIEPAWREQVLADYRELFERMNTGAFFEYGRGDLVQVGQLLKKALRGKQTLAEPTSGDSAGAVQGGHTLQAERTRGVQIET